MKRGSLFQLDVPHREPMVVRGYVFGNEQGARSCAIVGSVRGNEIQQSFICANLVARLTQLERAGRMAADKGVLVIPCCNPFSMNTGQRFWPTDDTDINRRFPGNAQGDTTERIAAAIMRVVRTYAYGIQLCSFNQAGDFLPHVRIMRNGETSAESLARARDFGLPYILDREPTPFDKKTLNYTWQDAGTHAFSLYSMATDRIDLASARSVEDAMLRFFERRGILVPANATAQTAAAQTQQTDCMTIRESELVDVRTQHAAGYFVTGTHAGSHVRKGQELARVLDAFDAHVLESLVAPCNGQVFFMRTGSIVQQHMVVFRIVPQ